MCQMLNAAVIKACVKGLSYEGHMDGIIDITKVLQQCRIVQFEIVGLQGGAQDIGYIGN